MTAPGPSVASLRFFDGAMVGVWMAPLGGLIGWLIWCLALPLRLELGFSWELFPATMGLGLFVGSLLMAPVTVLALPTAYAWFGSRSSLIATGAATPLLLSLVYRTLLVQSPDRSIILAMLPYAVPTGAVCGLLFAIVFERRRRDERR